MKKRVLVTMMALALAFSMVGCGSTSNKDEAETPENTTDENEETEAPADTDADAETPADAEEPADAETPADTLATEIPADGVMTYADYAAAELDTPVVIEASVQAKQSWWDNKATLYTQDSEGAYFIYELPCTEADYAALVPGTKIRVSGYKSEWSGEVEITDATFQIIEGEEYIASAVSVNDLLGTDSLIDLQNQFVSFEGMTVEAAGQDAEGNDVAFLYNWDGSGEDGNDLYFNASLNGTTYTFTVESYLCDNTTDVYAAVKNLQIGDVIDMEGFLYWYEGANPHITSVTVK